MHKCGSSTVQNILMRRGYTRELNFVLPSKGKIFFSPIRLYNFAIAGHYLGSPDFFSRSVVDGRFFSENEQFDIFTHHSRFSARDVDEVMPPDTKKVTILREPAALFESLYNYYRLNRGGFGYSLSAMLDYKPEALHLLSQMNTRWGGIIGFNQVRKHKNGGSLSLNSDT
jgi:Galactose-3-O-sulfotransferase